MKVKFINVDAIKEELELAGWMAGVSYDKDGNDLKRGENCIKSGHGTPTRPMRFIFEISEVSRVLSHEFVRHEIGVAKGQRSQRYVNEDGFGYVTPNGIKNMMVLVNIPHIVSDGREGYIVADTIQTWLDFSIFQDIVKQMYNEFVEMGAKNEDARYALTNATYTKLRVSFDWEGLQQFCYRRCCSRAQWEIRELAYEIKKLVTEAYPFLGKYLGAHCDIHGYCPENKGCGKAPSKEEFNECYIMGKTYLENLRKRGTIIK